MTVARALVAEDDPQVRTLACRLLTQLGIEAEGVADGLDALLKLQAGPYSLLVTDLDMPRLNGHSLVTALRSEGNAIPILVISGVGDGSDVVELFRQDVGEYVRKPFRRREFEASVRRLTDAPAANDDVRPAPAPSATPNAEAAPAVEAPEAPAEPPVVAVEEPEPEDAAPTNLAEALEQLPQALARGKLELPAPLPSMAQLVQMRRDPNISSQAIVNMVSASPSLAAAAVRTANTAFYNRGTKVSSLSQAAIRLGNRALINLAMTVLHQRFYRVRNAELQRIVDATWSATLLTARLTRELAQATYGVDADDAYLAALFHNAGDMVILGVADRYVPSELSAKHLAVLRLQCRNQHELVGAKLLSEWDFPPQCVRIALSHHTGRMPAGHGELKRSERRLVDVINVALHFAQALAPRGSISHPPDLELDQSLKAVDLTLARARDIAERMVGHDQQGSSAA